MGSVKRIFRNVDSGEREANRFIELASRIEELGELAGVHVKAFHSKEIPHFKALSPDKKREILSSMKVYIEICEITLASGESLQSTKALTWYALKHLNLRFRSDLLDKISHGDILEVYSKDNIQLFRNFRFMELISYTVEDIYCRCWTELFWRKDEEKAIELLNAASKFYTKEVRETISLEHLGHHRIGESNSAFLYEYDYFIKYLSPLLSKEMQPIGYIMIESAEILNPISTALEKEVRLKSYYQRFETNV